MSIIDSNVKELLSRFASDILAEIPQSIITPEMEVVISDVYKARTELSKPNVLSAVYKIHSEYMHPITSEDLSNDDLIYICENNHIKNTLIEFDLKLTDALCRHKDNPLFNWHELSENLLGTLKPKGINKLVYLDELDFEEDRVVASWGYPTLDKWLEGGITESSYTVFYAPSGAGKSQAVTIQMSANIIKQGKIPLIIALEGSPKKFRAKIIATLAGIADIDPRHYTDEHKAKLIEVSKTMPHIPLINKGCSKRWELEKYINIFKPDVLLYDQITISGQGRDWEKMASVSEMLKQISMNLGVPVIAVTQSSEKNYNNISDSTEDDLKTQDHIKYSSAVFEDATHVIEIKKHDENSSFRSFTVRKTKDDNTSSLLPLRLILELTPKGYEERYFWTAQGTRHELSEILDNTVVVNTKPIVSENNGEIKKFKLKRRDV